MIVSFSFPSPARFGGGLAELYKYANAMARRGHEVNFIHGPAFPERIESVDELTWFTFEPSISHYIVDSLDDPSLPDGDVMFQAHAPAHLGQPAVLIQGYKLLDAAIERPAYRSRCPKVCVARWLADIGEAWGSPREQMLHVPLGIDHDVFQVRTPVDERSIDVAMLYTDHPVKGGADGLAAIERARQQHPDLRVQLFGYLPPVGDLPPWASFRQAPDHQQLATEVYGQARVFVQPSWREGFGLTAVEAMACGSALLTTDNGGSRDYAIPDRTAVVVPPRSPVELGDALAALLADEPRRARLAEAGADHVRRFTWERAAEQLEGHLVRYLADPAALQHPPVKAPVFLDEAW